MALDKLKELINGKSKKDKYKARNNVRHVFQSFWFLLTNSFFEGFKTGKIYGGKWKQLCVPGMNCYSCPGAKGSCPIGALQAVIGSPKFKFSYYVVGFLFFVGALIGRGVCGYLCPFGLVQDLLHKIPFVKKIETFKGDKALRKAKYLILLVFVILLPLFLVDIIGQGAPYFCKLICPVGMMEGGIPLVLMNKSMRGAIGFLYAWKGLILILTIFLSIVIYRPFCKYICPLGAIYSLFNSVSLFRYTLDHQKCIHCGRCKAVCEMQCDPVKNCNDLECIRCGKCKNACPVDAIACGITKLDVSKETVKAKA
nr:4Fe-4S binding protein [Oribacterium parvum]